MNGRELEMRLEGQRRRRTPLPSHSPNSRISAGTFAEFGNVAREPATRIRTVDAGNVRLAAQHDSAGEVAYGRLTNRRCGRRQPAAPEARPLGVGRHENPADAFFT